MLLGLSIAGVLWMLKLAWERVFENEDPQAWRAYAWWVTRGLVGPILVWVVLGGGLWPGLTALLPELAGRRGTAGFLGAVAEATGPVALLAATLWVAVTAGWLSLLARDVVQDRQEYHRLLGFWTLVLALPAWGIWHVWGWYAIGAALSVWLVPICWFVTSMPVESIPPPNYSKAIARAKFGRYSDAEQAVIEELEHHQEDYEGWLMLAELYATQFRDLAEADRTVRQLCSQPGISPMQISRALNRLADWHLRLGQDPAAARAALEDLARVLPGSHEATMARQRLAQLPKSKDELLESQRPRAIPLPALADAPDPAGMSEATMSAAEARARAETCVERLRDDPNRLDAREEFARLLAGPLGQPTTAIDQLELLIALPDQPERRRAEWIALIAAWQEHHLRDLAAARQTWQRLIRTFPQTPQAFAAQRKLSLLEVDERIRQKPQQPSPVPKIKLRE